MKLKNAAQATAYCGRSTRVDTMVAIEFAASFMPLRKSNASATAISATSSGRASPASIVFSRLQLHVLDDDAVHHVGDVVEAVDDLLEVVVDLVADEEGEPVPPAVGPEELVQALVVHLVGLALQRRNLLGDR